MNELCAFDTGDDDNDVYLLSVHSPNARNITDTSRLKTGDFGQNKRKVSPEFETILEVIAEHEAEKQQTMKIIPFCIAIFPLVSTQRKIFASREKHLSS